MPRVIQTTILIAVALGTSWRANAADPITVESLLGDGFKVVAAVPSPIGPGLFLEKGAELYGCFVSEKAGSPALTTVYCKPVH